MHCFSGIGCSRFPIRMHYSFGILNRITTFLDDSLDSCNLEENNIYWMLCDEHCEAECIIREYYNSVGDDCRADYMKDKLLQCHKARKLRRKVRKLRRGLLYVYYFVFLLMIIALFLHTELAPIITNGPLKSVNLYLITLWSLIIILIEIMLKEIIEEAILHVLNKRIGGYGEWF